MHRIVRTARPQWRSTALVRAVRPVIRARPVIESSRPVLRRAVVGPEIEEETAYHLDPYVDYAQVLTEEGGIMLVYKDLDLRWRHTLWQLCAWWSFTGCEAWLALRHLDATHPWVAIASLAVAGIVNAIIVTKPVEIYRRVEIRPDCLILEGEQVFWQRYMDAGWPALRPDAEGNQVLCGIYGTRFVEYLTIRRFDDEDRMPEIFAVHLHAAMEQLWTQPP
jgi:hypothetical protein